MGERFDHFVGLNTMKLRYYIVEHLQLWQLARRFAISFSLHCQTYLQTFELFWRIPCTAETDKEFSPQNLPNSYPSYWIERLFFQYYFSIIWHQLDILWKGSRKCSAYDESFCSYISFSKTVPDLRSEIWHFRESR